MDTDTALATASLVSIVLCCVCGLVLSYRKRIKPSRSNTDLQSMMESSV